MSAQRKILIVSNRVPYPLTDGGNMAMYAMIEGYNRAGWQVYLLAMNTSRHHVDEAILPGLYTNIHKFEWYEFNNDISNWGIIKNYLFSKEAEHVERFYQPEFESKLLEIVDEFNPDVIQMESVYLSTYLPAIRKATNAVTVLRMHNIEYQIWFGLAQKSANRIRRKYLYNLTGRLKTFEREAWRMYDLLLPITEKDAYHISRLEKIMDVIIAPYSIDESKFPVLDESKERWVGYHIGAMDWIPNREGVKWFLDEVWNHIQKVVPKFEFYFAGRRMPEEFKEIKLTGVHCMSEVPDAAEFIADKKILIVPIMASGGIRVKILEAMAAGKIVISTPEGIIGIEAKSGEHYLVARKPEDFVKAVKWCMMNKEEAQAMALRGRELVRNKYEHNSVIRKVISELETFMKLRNQ